MPSKSKSVSAAALPRGLWVGKQQRRGAPKRDHSVLREGERPWDRWPEDFQPCYYFRIVKKGVPMVQRSTETGDYREAVRRARMVYDTAVQAKWDARAQGLLDMQGKRKVCLLGRIFEAYRSGPEFAADRDRIVQSARLVVAMAKGWHVEGRQIVEHGEVARRIDGLPSDVLCRELVRDYLTVCQGGTYRPAEERRENISINKRLRMARQLFTRRAMELCYDGVALPDVEGFLKFPALPEPRIDLEEESIDPGDYARMLRAAEGLEGGTVEERELALVNRCLRELGLRNSEMLAARADWLVWDGRGGRWYLDIRDRPEQGYKIKGAEPGRVPVSDGLMELLRGRMVWGAGDRVPGFLIMPEGLPTHRFDLIYRTHNDWLKPMIGEIRSGKGNHRLRKYVATLLAEQYGVAVASQYLRHAGEMVTLRNYVARRRERLPVVDTALLETWGARG